MYIQSTHPSVFDGEGMETFTGIEIGNILGCHRKIACVSTLFMLSVSVTWGGLLHGTICLGEYNGAGRLGVSVNRGFVQ